MKLETILSYIIRQIDRISPNLAARISVEILFRPRRAASSKTEKAFWESGKPIEFSSGCRGRVFGAGGERSVWIIHGWTSRGSNLKKLITACLETGCEVVAWDGPAHGDSPGKRSSLAPFTKTLVTDINSSERKPDAFIGHSFGGAASAYACRLGITAKLLVLISAASSTVGMFERYWDFLGLGPKARNKFMEIVERETGVEVDSMSSANFISTLPQKVLVIHDREDSLVPLSDATKLRDIRSDVEIFETHKLGHNRVLHDEKVCARVSKFLTDNLPPIESKVLTKEYISKAS